MFLFPAQTLTLAVQNGAVTLSRDGGPPEPVAQVQGFGFRYIYAVGGAEQIVDSYQGPTLTQNGVLYTLYALGLYAEASSNGVNRSFTERLRLGRGATPIREVLSCGGSALVVGYGTVAVEIRGAPRGNVALLAGNWNRTVTTTTVLTNVPLGPLQVTAYEVWDGDTLWRVQGQPQYSETRQVEGYAVTRVVLDYQAVAGALEVEISGLPEGAQVPVNLGDGRQTSPLGNGLHRLELAPAEYRLAFLPYNNQFSPDPTGATVRIASQQTVRVAVRYEPNPYRLNLNVRLRGGGASSLSPKVCIQPADTVQGGISPDAEVPDCLFR
ncbi:MAG: hypothetical protein K6T70_10240 [Meiothermus ruber]|uniref:hypothetical protein n=1 Tax=Meiothermus ruber TaxID=277 RepID=UPI0023F6A57D|nr:hypothetical protein [Meiothermus ruber]MCL6530474.1 hypothetical protein [Meiothermus ruber]